MKTSLGIWAKAEPRLAQADNARAALQFVSRGEAALGIVYETDAHADPSVKVVATFPETTHVAFLQELREDEAAVNALWRALEVSPAGGARRLEGR